ncbi:endonuclease NucS domain-containing protein [Cryptosporangium arvum]|uniref:Putative nuclease of the RecB family n=1 Tax=Cryptosporangium arvum DSM 44712 TaxID=927661 RepID=A0A011AK79_9ACTN|nr:endonuclease NucS domain-containing protein [Cryptosporangium arvum]EXG82376.1 putative nuclease of the RecB family [Cryptosporangium arvum DSM 44712]
MPVEIALWRADTDPPSRLAPTGVPLESQLEQLIETDPAILGEPLLLIGRQVPTGYGTFIDLLAVDAEGGLHVLELKRARTPREVVAQTLDYGSWVVGLSHSDVHEVFAGYRPGLPFEAAFAERFGAAPPDELNTRQHLTIVASDIDPATERIVSYLNTGFAVPVNVLFFRYFTDADRSYLARTWLLDDAPSIGGRPTGTRRGTREEWNGQDWYVAFGEEAGSRNWDDARSYGFVSAGGGTWFTKTLRALPVGARIFVHIPKNGYVGVGIVAGPAQTSTDAVLTINLDRQQFTDLALQGSYRLGEPIDPDHAEYIVPVEWIHTRDRDQAIWQRGMFANQNSACKLRNQFTLDALSRAFGLENG